MSTHTVRKVTVIGSGVIGTSIALAVRRGGVDVRLADRDPDAVTQARGRGAGVALRPEHAPADVVVLATPPSAVVAALREAQRRGLGNVYTDVAGAKARIVADARAAGCDLASYVPGHPMAGSELSGPAAAHADLFQGRAWALCPGPQTAPEALDVVSALVALCGARRQVLAADVHDRLVAAVSHVPHLVAAALAARFAGDDTALSLAGRGLRDVTRIAGGPAALWTDILRHNATPVAAVLEQVAADLATAARTLREPGPAGPVLADLLRRGNRGRAAIAAAVPPPETGDAVAASRSDHAELARLRTENAALREERDGLRRFVAGWMNDAERTATRS